MSEPLEQRLSRLTPDGAGLDRDALLFAAGRASARPGRRWQALAGILAASQVLTLALLWPRPAPLTPAPNVAPVPPPVVAEEKPPPSPDPCELGALRARLLSGEGDLPRSPLAGPFVPAGPPLHAFAASRSVLPN